MVNGQHMVHVIRAAEEENEKELEHVTARRPNMAEKTASYLARRWKAPFATLSNAQVCCSELSKACLEIIPFGRFTNLQLICFF